MSKLNNNQMIGFIGNKVGMTSVFDKQVGGVVGVSVIKINDNKVIEKRTQEKNSYSAITIGYGNNKKEKRKPLLGKYKKNMPKKIKEFRLVEDDQNFKIGDVLDFSSLKELKYVNIRGTSIGKGFQGVVKRWNMHGGPATHGSRFHRIPGSVGNCSSPARVFKGKKMPGRMGGKQVIVKNLRVLKVDEESKLLVVKGSIPGFKKNYIYISKSAKGNKN